MRQVLLLDASYVFPRAISRPHTPHLRNQAKWGNLPMDIFQSFEALQALGIDIILIVDDKINLSCLAHSNPFFKYLCWSYFRGILCITDSSTQEQPMNCHLKRMYKEELLHFVSDDAATHFIALNTMLKKKWGTIPKPIVTHSFRLTTFRHPLFISEPIGHAFEGDPDDKAGATQQFKKLIQHIQTYKPRANSQGSNSTVSRSRTGTVASAGFGPSGGRTF
jgi:hypothetical protein